MFSFSLKWWNFVGRRNSSQSCLPSSVLGLESKYKTAPVWNMNPLVLSHRREMDDRAELNSSEMSLSMLSRLNLPFSSNHWTVLLAPRGASTERWALQVRKKTRPMVPMADTDHAAAAKRDQRWSRLSACTLSTLNSVGKLLCFCQCWFLSVLFEFNSARPQLDKAKMRLTRLTLHQFGTMWNILESLSFHQPDESVLMLEFTQNCSFYSPAPFGWLGVGWVSLMKFQLAAFLHRVDWTYS